MDRSTFGVHMGDASKQLAETLSELVGASNISDIPTGNEVPRDFGNIDLNKVLSRSPMSTSKFLEFIPVPDELALYSFPIRFGKMVENPNNLRKIPLDKLLSDISAWRFKLCGSQVPTLSEGFDGCMFKSDSAIRKRYKLAIDNGMGFLDAFNDILIFRIKVQEYPVALPKYFKIVDMWKGKDLDLGYRAIHLYFQCSELHYPIEIQLWSVEDWEFNSWGKSFDVFTKDGELGRQLRVLYDLGKITNIEQFNRYRVSLKGGSPCT